MSGEKPFLAICNPAAGGGRCGQQAGPVIDRLRAAGIPIDVQMTAAAGQATEIARSGWRSGYRRFLAMGGDGTSFEVVNGLFPEAEAGPEPPVLGFLPLGTGNSFLRDFSPQAADYSVDSILQGRERSCDVLRLRHKAGDTFYINILSLGWVADVNGLRARTFSSLGEAGYILSVLTMVARLKPSSLPFRSALAKTNGTDASTLRHPEPVTFLSINNSRFTGGKMMMAPEADTGDGLADLLIVGTMGRLRLLSCFPRIFKGTHIRMPEVGYHKVSEVQFEFDREVDIMIDGEAMRVTPRRVDVIAGALRILA